MFKAVVRLPLLLLSVTVYSVAPMACTYTALKLKFSMLSFERYQFEYSSVFRTGFGGFISSLTVIDRQMQSMY